MIKEIVKDPLVLRKKSVPASPDDVVTAQDLLDMYFDQLKNAGR